MVTRFCGYENGGEYNTEVKLNVVGMETGLMGMKGGHAFWTLCTWEIMEMSRKWVRWRGWGSDVERQASGCLGSMDMKDDDWCV